MRAQIELAADVYIFESVDVVRIKVDYSWYTGKKVRVTNKLFR